MKTLLIILSLAAFCIGANFDTLSVDSVYITVEHEFSFEVYKVLARCWWKVGKMWYVLTVDGEAWSAQPIRLVR